MFNSFSSFYCYWRNRYVSPILYFFILYYCVLSLFFVFYRFFIVWLCCHISHLPRSILFLHCSIVFPFNLRHCSIVHSIASILISPLLSYKCSSKVLFCSWLDLKLLQNISILGQILFVWLVVSNLPNSENGRLRRDGNAFLNQTHNSSKRQVSDSSWW